MKTVILERDFAYVPDGKPQVTVMYRKRGNPHERVPEAAVAKIVASGAGRVLAAKKADTSEAKEEKRGRRKSS